MNLFQVFHYFSPHRMCDKRRERMDLHLVFKIILSVWLMKASSLVAYFPRNQSCENLCGVVVVSYPFGMNEGCFFNEGFKISCNDSSGSFKPYLSGTNLEVLYIDLSSFTVSVNLPVFSSNCNKNSTGEVVDLSGSPFYFSDTANRFTATGCDNFATMTDNNTIIGGCLSTCPTGLDSNKIGSGCYGIGCCQIPIPPNLQVLNASINETSESHHCRSAFISLMSSSIDALKDEEYVNATLTFGGTIAGQCYEIDDGSMQPLCNGNYCTVKLSETHLCLCSEDNSSPTPNYICTGTMICLNSTSRDNCSSCPQGYYQDEYTYSSPWCYSLESIFMYRRLDKKSRVRIIIIIGCSAGLGTLFLVIGAWGLYKVVKRRKAIQLKQKFFKRNGGLLLQQQLSSNEHNIEKTKLFASKELEMATDNYNKNRILGRGGQGTVYKGMLSNGRIVAIKRSTIVDENNLEQFINEVVILTQINHRNVVKLLGCCLETDVPLLVYEFIPNGTLFQYIHDQTEELPLTWEIRLRIVVEVADAVSYLHSAASIPIYHRDIKSANILLDDKYRAKVSDFGTSRSVAIDQTHLTTQVQGTFGYLDPEFFRSSQFTEKSDVYSFGVVLIELLTGQKPIRLINNEEEKSLVVYFLNAIKENRLFEILDARVVKEGEKEEIMKVGNLAKRCLNHNGKKRPTMKEVAMELSGIRSTNGAFIVQGNFEELDFVDDDANICFETGTSSGRSFLNSFTKPDDVEPLILSN